MDKIESSIPDIVSDEAFNAVADYLGQFDLKIEKMVEKVNKFETLPHQIKKQWIFCVMVWGPQWMYDFMRRMVGPRASFLFVYRGHTLQQMPEGVRS